MRKTVKKAIICVLLALVLISTVACTAVESVVPQTQLQSQKGQLEILKSDKKLTQEQVMSQIKAEYLLENKGYKDSDEVVVILTLKDKALIDSYNDTYYKTYATVGDYADSPEGKAQAKAIAEQQTELIQTLQRKGLAEEVKHSYSTIMNGIAVTIKYGNLKKVEKLSRVGDVILSDTYNMPQATKAGSAANVVENLVDVYETGIFNSGSVSYTGVKTAVAILDSGFDCSHSVFQNQPEGELLITEQTVSAFLAGQDGKSNAVGTTPDLKLSDVYYSDKIPFVYDYADKDPDVFPYDSEHGTHVAGIIGGKDSEITGVAINTQLVLMKVFPDLNEGADTDDILAALEDAVLLKVDAINMSLGSSCGFTREEDGNKINEVYDKINESGISLMTAASNSYSSGFGGEQGNTSFVTNPDNGTVGSPSTYEAALSVASISGVKSKYITASDDNGDNAHTFFFLESNAINGDANDFMKELYALLRKSNPTKYSNLSDGDEVTLEYVTVPGVGLRVNYSSIDVTGKIALVRRGDNTFEDKAQIAQSKGAIACIIYNNIDGEIYMSMGKKDHIPTVSISKDDGTILASRKGGKMVISGNNQAGPFMSDFSSWGPTPSLELKPDITAHGGNIRSSVPGGGYDELSGTSMATPNLCGIVVLIRQYIKDNFPELSMKEMAVLANELMMSTAEIVLNQEGNPYSPRKQGAGLASLYNAVNTKAYITVDNKDRSKLELGDDPERKGVYKMSFNVKNLSDKTLSYNLDFVGMTESVSSSDNKHIAEKAKILEGSFAATVNGQSVDKITVQPNSVTKVDVVYTLTNADKKMIDSLFPYGMYVEGFIKLIADYSYETVENGQTVQKNGIDMNVPFLAFYGDWTEAPMFDKTFYEVESEAHNQAIDEEDKIKADYYATTPYGSYFYNYIVPLGSYLYDIDTSKYDEIPATEEHIAISNVLGTIDGISAVYAGLLRNAKTMVFTITDKVTGEVVYEHTDHNATKAYSLGSSPMPYYEFLKISSYKLQLVNNRQYEFKMQGLLDYGDGGASTNVRNSFSFDFYLDDEAPIVKEVSYEKEYDKSLKKDRYYINMTVYDNHYVQSITPLVFTSSGTQVDYATLTNNPIPVYGERGEDATVRFEITDYLEDALFDELITNGLAFAVDDYALNSNIYVCQLPGTIGDFKFTKDGSLTGTSIPIMSAYQNEVLDLTTFLASADNTDNGSKDYFKYLEWTSSNEKVATVKEGVVVCHGTGITTITVTELMNGKKANLNLKVNATGSTKDDNLILEDVSKATVKSLRFSYFDTLFAHTKAGQQSEIGETGDRKFLSSMPIISFYPGEQVKLCYDLDPWYAADNYDYEYSTTNDTVATVTQDGVVSALKKGNATITLKITNKATGATSNIMASVRLEVKSEFIIENRMLVAYKGLGGKVVIPDDEGILYIGPYSFCLFETDNNIEITEDDFDANKIPATNTTVTSVVIPYGVEDIQKYAFYNCFGLEEVQIPSSCKYIREYAFYGDEKLESIKLTGSETVGLEGTKVETIGAYAFHNCAKLDNVDLSKVFAMGIRAFEGCTSLKKADLRSLRNSGAEVFKDCTALASVRMNENTKLSKAMFVKSGLKTVDIYEKVAVPDFCFAKCENLKTVNVHNSLVSIGYASFSDCTQLTSFNWWTEGVTVSVLDEQAFYNCAALEEFTLPNGSVTLGSYCFYKCSSLNKIVFGQNTELAEVKGTVFQDTKLSVFDAQNSNKYSSDTENGLLLSKDGQTVIFAAVGKDYSAADLVLNYKNIGDSAFSGTNVKTVTFPAPVNIGNYAFANCEALEKVNLSDEKGTVIGEHSFNNTKALRTVANLNVVESVGNYAFANSGLREVVIGSNAVYGEGAFFQSEIVEVTIGENTRFGLGAFQKCVYLETVNMPANGGVHFGKVCFAYDDKLATIDLSKVDDTIEEQTFYGCLSLQTAILTNVKHIGDYAFADCGSLRYVDVPVVETIGEGAFGKNDENLRAPVITEIELPESLTTLGKGAFLGCEGLTELKLPSKITEVPDYLCSFCVQLQAVTLHDNISAIGDYAFMGCEALTEINLGKVRNFGEFAFAKCAILEKVDLTSAEKIGTAAFSDTWMSGEIVAENLTFVDALAFQNAEITSFTANNLRHIGQGAFIRNNMTEFVLSADLEYIGSQAFYGCYDLTTFSFFKDGAKTTNGKINDYALLDDGILYTVMQSGNLQLTSVPAAKSMETLTVLENTYRVDLYAGNENKNVTKIVLPDTMKLIGNYAFFGYSKLASVEFKSFTAPALENSYDSNAKLTEGDPGYKLLHAYFDLGGWDMGYYNFVNLVGKNVPIEMVLPANEGVTGYDSLIYLAYFGSVDDAKRSDYIARDKNLVQFYEYAKEIASLKTVTLINATLINNAISAYNAIPTNQNPSDYGYSAEEWKSLVDKTLSAKEQLRLLQLSNASLAAQQLQTELDNLPDSFEVSQLSQLAALSERISKLTAAERMLLDMTKYNNLQNGLNAYNEALLSEMQGVKTAVDGVYSNAAAVALAAVAVAIILKRRCF